MTKIKLFKTKDNKVNLEVSFEKDTVWLSQSQMALLFDKTIPTINEHIKNIYTENELDKTSTVRDFLIVQKEGSRDVKRSIAHYNLDVIISVGYRVKSKRGTQFRIWATNTLNTYLRQGYLVNEKRLKEKTENLVNLQNQILNLQQVVTTKDLTLEQTKALVEVISYYSESLQLLDKFDKNELGELTTQHEDSILSLEHKELSTEIDRLRVSLNEGNLFGLDKENSLKSILEMVEQTFGGNPLYPSIEKRAASLLYFIIKNHPFVDGNKRIGSFTFIKYLEVNNLLLRDNGVPVIEKNTLVAIALLIAQSDPKDKDLMIDLVIYLLGM